MNNNMTYQQQYKKLVKDILAMPDIPNDRTKQTIQRYNGTIVGMIIMAYQLLAAAKHIYIAALLNVHGF